MECSLFCLWLKLGGLLTRFANCGQRALLAPLSGHTKPDTSRGRVWAWVQVYTNIKKLKEDLAKHPPHHFVCVPLVLDTLYGRVRSRAAWTPHSLQHHCHCTLSPVAEAT